MPEVPEDRRVFGDRWLAAPSVIVPESANLLLNPAHPSAAAARVVASRRFVFDARPWAP